MSKIIRCAIYTRKSTEDGLEQEFNSLHAQREACEAYANSQRSEGWRIIKTPYDDGGFSGGNMGRPGFKHLMKDIEDGRIDIVLVYKIDRLTRSLADFARIVDMFDEKHVSFVSVTQQFNTATSMGRLTLNMLLSFAQFEREVTGERIRDKVAASKKKGMWMGGVVPIGYKNIDKKLVINRGKANTIQSIFNKYLDLGTVRLLKHWCDEQGLGTIPRNNPKAIQPFSRGHLYKILGNPLYKGMIAHKGQIYEGQHEAIIDQDIFEQVQQALNKNAVNRKSDKSQPLGSLLTSKVKDEAGDRLVPIYTVKAGKRYRYYVSAPTRQGPKNTIDGWRLPAKMLEGAVTASLIDYIKKHDGLIKDCVKAGLCSASLSKAQEQIKELKEQDIVQNARALIQSITIKPSELVITLDTHVILKMLNTDPHPEPILLITTQPFTHQRRGVEQRLIFGNLKQSNIDEFLLSKLKDAQSWYFGLTNGTYISIKDISQKTGLKPTNVSRYIPLAFLAPDIKEAILDGSHPPALTLESLKKIRPLPASWKEQRIALGF